MLPWRVATIRHEAEASEAEEQHGPRGGFGDGRREGNVNYQNALRIDRDSNAALASRSRRQTSQAPGTGCIGSSACEQPRIGGWRLTPYRGGLRLSLLDGDSDLT